MVKSLTKSVMSNLKYVVPGSRYLCEAVADPGFPVGKTPTS